MGCEARGVWGGVRLGVRVGCNGRQWEEHMRSMVATSPHRSTPSRNTISTSPRFTPCEHHTRRPAATIGVASPPRPYSTPSAPPRPPRHPPLAAHPTTRPRSPSSSLTTKGSPPLLRREAVPPLVRLVLQRTYVVRRPCTHATGVPARPAGALGTSGAAAAVATIPRNAASTTTVAADIEVAVPIDPSTSLPRFCCISSFVGRRRPRLPLAVLSPSPSP